MIGDEASIDQVAVVPEKVASKLQFEVKSYSKIETEKSDDTKAINDPPPAFKVYDKVCTFTRDHSPTQMQLANNLHGNCNEKPPTEKDQAFIHDYNCQQINHSAPEYFPIGLVLNDQEEKASKVTPCVDACISQTQLLKNISTSISSPSSDARNVAKLPLVSTLSMMTSIACSLPNQSVLDKVSDLYSNKTTTGIQAPLSEAFYRRFNLKGPREKSSTLRSTMMLRCAICSDIFYENVKFKQHMDMHEQVALLKKDPPKLLKPGTFECKFCQAIFDDKDRLKQHLLDEHEKEYVHTQPIDQLYQCSFCGKTFVDYNKLVHHHQMHQQGNREVFTASQSGGKDHGNASEVQQDVPVAILNTVNEMSYAKKDLKSPLQTPCGKHSLYVTNYESHRSISPGIKSQMAIYSDKQHHFRVNQSEKNVIYKSCTLPFENQTSDPLNKKESETEINSDSVSLSESPKDCIVLAMPSIDSAISDKQTLLQDSSPMTMLDFKPVKDVLIGNEIDKKEVNTKIIIGEGDVRKYRCNICDEMFETQEKRAQHSLLHVNRSNTLSCHICGKQFRHRTNLTTHMIVHSGIKPHQCHICLRRFTQKVNLQRHMHIHDGSRPFSCCMCNKSFTQKANLQRHILSHTERSQENLLEALSNIPNESEVNNAINESLSEAILNEHSSESIPPRQSESVSQFHCALCDKSFAQKVNLQKHMMIHSGERPFQCYVCGKSFRQKTALQKHYTVHTHGSTNFNCQTCQRRFGSTTNLQRHMLVHVKPGNNNCYLCDQKFSTSDNLERHFSEHIEEDSPALAILQNNLKKSNPRQNFKCSKCDIVFESTSILSQHMQLHQSGFGPKDAADIVKAYKDIKNCPIECSVCGQIFKTADKLDMHMFSHTNDNNTLASCSTVNDTDVNINKVAGVFIDDERTSLKDDSREVEGLLVALDYSSTSTPTMSAIDTLNVSAVSRCPVCKEKFPSKHEMRIHFSSLHMQEISQGDGLRLKSDLFANSFDLKLKDPTTKIGSKIVETDLHGGVTVISEDEERLIKENVEFIKDNIHGGTEEYESKGRYERGHYSCKICNRVLTYKYSLEKHILLHTGSFPYKCTLCSKRFNHKANLDKHMVVHSGLKPYSCHICARPFSQKSNLQRHQLTHTQNRDYICDVCGKRFNHMASLKTHSLIHTGAKPFSCYICMKRFNQKGNLKRHIQTHRTGKRNRISSSSHTDHFIENEITKEFGLESCNEQIEGIVSQSSDKTVCEEQKSNTKKKRKSKKERKKHQFPLSEQSLPTMISKDFDKSRNSNKRCFEFGESVPNIVDKIHEDTIVTVFPSDQCASNNPKEMSELLGSTEEERYTCDVCPKFFVSSLSLESHRQAAHCEILCDVCGKHFSQKANLLKHKLIHANKKPFSCKVCSKAFRQKANLQRHELIHDKERKSVSCEKCGKTFRCNWSLKQHMKSHSQNRPFGCSICGKTFKQRAILKRHFLVHNGLRSFTCSICNKAFNHKGNLLRHMAVHEEISFSGGHERNVLKSEIRTSLDNCSKISI